MAKIHHDQSVTGSSAEDSDADALSAKIILAIERQIEVAIPESWEDHLNNATENYVVDARSRVKQLILDHKPRSGQLPIEVDLSGSSRKIHLPSNWGDSPCDLKRIISIIISRLQFTIETDRDPITIQDPPGKEKVLEGIMLGLEDKLPFTKLKSDTRDPYEQGRNICNWERRLAYCHIRGVPVSSLHIAKTYAGSTKDPKLLTQVLRCCAPPDLKREKAEVWNSCVTHIEALIKCYFRDLLRSQGPTFSAPVEIFKTFDETWANHQIIRTVESTTTRKVKGRDKKVSISRVVRYHPKKPSSLVGLLDSELELVRNLYDEPWLEVNEIKSNWTNLLNSQGWEWLNSRLKDLSDKQSIYYNFVRKAVNARVRQCDSRIPARDEFRKWLKSHDTEQKRGKLIVGQFAPLCLLEERIFNRFFNKVLPRPTFTNAVKGKFDDLSGWKVAWESYVNQFELDKQVDQIKGTLEAEKSVQEPIETQLTTSFSELAVDDDKLDELLKDSSTPADRAKKRHAQEGGDSLPDLSLSAILAREKKVGKNRKNRNPGSPRSKRDGW